MIEIIQVEVLNSTVNTRIRERFNEEFAGDLQLMYITLNIDKKRRVLSINMIVRDAISNEMYPITTEATLESNV